MSYKTELSHLERDGERSLTQQIVATIQSAIESGELAPGEKLPPTRELAETADINHLTAVRAYRRLREMGLVSSQVGRGTRRPPPCPGRAGTRTTPTGSGTSCRPCPRATATASWPRCTGTHRPAA
jgi:DNA-binding transcriptional MocR family regulator